MGRLKNGACRCGESRKQYCADCGKGSRDARAFLVKIDDEGKPFGCEGYLVHGSIIAFDLAKGPATGAIFSECRKHRFALWRIWNRRKPFVCFIGLNPSTADETENDPTVSRCVRFAEEFGGGGLVMLNAFSYRATDPEEMKAQAVPNLHENIDWISAFAGLSRFAVAAWGTHGTFANQSDFIAYRMRKDLRTLHCLGANKDGTPKHPLYLRADTKLKIWAEP